jgi:hypothetical protein
MKRTLKTVSIIGIRIDGETQQRDSIDPHWVHEMVDNMKNDVEYPPLQVRFDGAHYWLSDGFHRYHAYTQLGIKNIEVAYLPGTQYDAQIDSYSANHDHGKPRSRADKIKAVQSALANPHIKDKNDAEIARICKVSKPFVASVRNPEQKKKQDEARKRNIVKKAEAIKNEEPSNQITSNPITTGQESPPISGEEPDEAELLANEKKREADMEMVANLLDSDDKMAHLWEENRKLTHEIVILDLRVKELMNEKNAAIKMVKDLQKQIDKSKAQK